MVQEEEILEVCGKSNTMQTKLNVSDLLCVCYVIIRCYVYTHYVFTDS